MKGEQGEQAEKVADRVREDLLLSVRELDRRRKDALDVRKQVAKHPWVVVGVSVGLLLAVGGGLGLAWYQREAIRRRRLRNRRIERFRALGRLWKHPDRIANLAPRRPLPAEVGGKAASALAGALASQLGRQLVSRLAPL